MYYYVYVEDQSQSIMCYDNESVLQAMRRHHVKGITYGCYNGGCGVCKIEVLNGEYEITGKMSRAYISEDEEKSGIVLACKIKPLGEMRVRVIGLTKETLEGKINGN